MLGVLLLQRLDLGVVELLDGRPLPAQNRLMRFNHEATRQSNQLTGSAE